MRKLLYVSTGRLPSTKTMTRSLKLSRLDKIRRISYEIVKQAIKNPIGKSQIPQTGIISTVDGIIDGSPLFSKRKACVFQIIRKGAPPLLLDIEYVRDIDEERKEGEIRAAERLLKRVITMLGPGFFKTIIADGYYKYWFISLLNELSHNGYKIHAVVKFRTHERNQDRVPLEVIEDAKELFSHKLGNIARFEDKENGKEGVIYDVQDLIPSKKEYSNLNLRVLKVTEKHINEAKSSKEETYYVLTTFRQEEMPAEKVRELAHSRWCIENNGFRDLKSFWDGRHEFVRDPHATEAICLMCFIVHNLLLLFLEYLSTVGVNNKKINVKQKTIIGCARELITSIIVNKKEIWKITQPVPT